MLQANRQIGSTRTLLEPLLILLCANAASLLLAWLVNDLVQGSPYRVLVSWASHLPQLVIPWVWYRVRVAPLLAPADRSLWRRVSGGRGRLFWTMLLVLGGGKFIGEAVLSWGAPRPTWALEGALPILLILLFQGLMVGFSEEMLFRPALHLPLKLGLSGHLRLGRVALSPAWLLSALFFGLFHLPNLLLGGSLPDVLAQAAFASFLALIFGYYYERTGDYVGTALLHNAADVASYIALLLVTR